MATFKGVTGLRNHKICNSVYDCHESTEPHIEPCQPFMIEIFCENG